MRPPSLQINDLVSIVAPSGRIKERELDGCVGILENWGLRTRIGQHAFDGAGFFSANDQDRLADIQNAFDDPDIKAVFCARGGFGVGKILDQLDFKIFKQSPKWIVGFSDITLLHLRVHNLGILSIHGPVARQMGTTVDENSISKLRDLLFKDDFGGFEFESAGRNINGVGEGPLIGGNLTLLCNSLRTLAEPRFEACVLFIEDVNEEIYRVDRNLNQLKRAGMLESLKGLVVGQFNSIKDTHPSYGKGVKEVILEYVASQDHPVCFDFPAGHENTNWPFPHGAVCELSVKSDQTRLRFRG